MEKPRIIDHPFSTTFLADWLQKQSDADLRWFVKWVADHRLEYLHMPNILIPLEAWHDFEKLVDGGEVR